MTGRKTRWIAFGIGALAVAIVIGMTVTRYGKPEKARASAPSAVPVVQTIAGQGDIPIYYNALGTVMALNTVAIRAQVTGQLISIDFTQGQNVHRGDVLARIDPAPFKAAFDQAAAKRAQDEAQLVDVEKDLVRFKTLVLKNAETQQNVDAQQAKVDTMKATINADQAAIEAVQTQLNWTTITAPIDGVVGFRQLDLGNIIHTTDANPLTLLTQITPSDTIFTLPQSDLGPVREAMLRGDVQVLAFDQDDAKQIAVGRLLLIDNQIDQSTSTIRLKAEFPNTDKRLWPGEFIHIHVLITTQKDAVTIPPVALQRGPNGLYVWVINADNTVEERAVEAQTVTPSTVIVSKGLKAGERIVLEGQSRLDAGTHVNIRPAAGHPEAGTSG